MTLSAQTVCFIYRTPLVTSIYILKTLTYIERTLKGFNWQPFPCTVFLLLRAHHQVNKQTKRGNKMRVSPQQRSCIFSDVTHKDQLWPSLSLCWRVCERPAGVFLQNPQAIGHAQSEKQSSKKTRAHSHRISFAFCAQPKGVLDWFRYIRRASSLRAI